MNVTLHTFPSLHRTMFGPVFHVAAIRSKTALIAKLLILIAIVFCESPAF